uniref:Uncharacterized protein n=1 Tax=Rhizophora mucronata TaxID=61149 RepID=A0A2P2QRF6_RHIMU
MAMSTVILFVSCSLAMTFSNC